MGKGKRTQIRSEQERILQEKQATAEMAAKKSRYLKTAIVSIVFVAFIFGAIFGTIWYEKAEKNGSFMRNKIVFETDNFEVDACMVQYFYNSAVKMFVENSSSNLETLGLDTTGDLKEQTCYYDKEKSWYEYFLESAQNQITEVLTLCEAAKAEGLELTDTDEKFIKESFDTMEETAENNGQTLEEYIDEIYGNKVNSEDIEECIRLTTLASNYYTKYTGGLTYSDAQISDYFENNKATYLSANYLYTVISNNAKGGETEAELKKLNKEAKATAKELSNAKNTTEFKEKLKAYYDEFCREYYAQYDYSDKEIEAQVETLMTSSEGKASYDISTNEGAWLFSKDRKTGDTTIIEKEDGSGYTVYCITSPAVKDTSETQNVRHVLLNSSDYEDAEACRKAAEKLLKKWRNGEKTEDSFATLAKEYSTDQGSASNGGLYENVPKGQMVETFENWIFDKKREVGDTDVVDTDYGSHIMYYCGKGHNAWKINVIADMKDKDYSSKLEDLKEKYEVEEDKGYFELIEFISDKVSEKETSSETE